MITVKLEGLDKALRSLDSGVVRKAAYMAINKAASGAKTEGNRAIRDKFNIKKPRLDKAMTNFRMASSNDLSAVIKAESRPIGLINFGARWVRNVGKRARTTTATKSSVAKRRSKDTGVLVSVEKGKTTRLKNAFIGRGRRGNEDGGGVLRVFQRADKSRSNSHLMSKSSVTVASMFGQKNVEERMVKKIGETFDKEFSRQLDRLLK